MYWIVRRMLGRAQALSSRTHESLKRGIDSNSSLQEDFKNGAEVAYFPLGIISKDDADRGLLLDYEKLYMYIVETHGKFELYNGEQPKKKNRTQNAILQLPSFCQDRERLDVSYTSVGIFLGGKRGCSICCVHCLT